MNHHKTIPSKVQLLVCEKCGLPVSSDRFAANPFAWKHAERNLFLGTPAHHFSCLPKAHQHKIMYAFKNLADWRKPLVLGDA